ncbi:hypothetical protein K8I28_01730 [bacterium]|nr:hypothetical protein [bacterium]
MGHLVSKHQTLLKDWIPARLSYLVFLAVLMSLAFSCPLFAVESNPPLEHEKKMVELEDGRVFAALDLPLFLRMGLAPEGGSSSTLLGDKAAKEGIKLREGENRVPFGMNTIIVFGDGTPPQVNSSFENANRQRNSSGTVYGANLSVSFSAADKGSGVQDIYLSINGAPYRPYRDPLTDFMRTREMRISYYAVDRVGNVSAVKEEIFWVDVTPPETDLNVSGVRDLEVYSPEVTLTLSSSDTPADVKTIFWQFDDVGANSYRGPVSVSNLSDGEHVFHYWAVDQVGNEEGHKTLNFYLDKTSSELSLEYIGEHHLIDVTTYVAFDVRVKLSAGDNRSGVKRITYSINGEEWMDYALPFALPQESGLYTIRYQSEDIVGNKSEILTAKAYLDKTPPNTNHSFGAITFREGERTALNSETAITLNPVDLEVGVETTFYSINGGKAQEYIEPLTFPEEGAIDLKYWAVDYVKNTEEAHLIQLQVDNRPRKAAEVAAPLEQTFRFIEDESGSISGPNSLPFYLRISASPEDTATSFLLAYNTTSKDTFPIKLPKEGKVPIVVSMPGNKQKFIVSGDDTPPRTRANYMKAPASQSKGNQFYGDGLEVQLHADDSGVGVEKTFYSIDGAQFVPYTVILDNFFREKPYTVNYYSVDAVGNAEKPGKDEFIVDLTAPYTTHKVQGKFYGATLSPSSEIVLSSSDNLSGVKNIYYSFDDGEPIRYKSVLASSAFNKLEPGKHVLNYWGVDNVDNTENRNQFRFSYDPIPP